VTVMAEFRPDLSTRVDLTLSQIMREEDPPSSEEPKKEPEEPKKEKPEDEPAE